MRGFRMKIAMVFPGYGSQYVGMAKELYDEHRIVQEYFEEASNCLPINFVKLCFASSEAEMAQLNHAYPALFLVSSALYALLKQEGIQPNLVTGFNQGEYAALFAVGTITFPDGLYLLNKYSTFYQEFLNDTDVDIFRVNGVPKEELEDFCAKASKKNQHAAIAIFYSDTSFAVGGTQVATGFVRELINKKFPDAKISSLPKEMGLHTSLMEPVANNLKIYLEKVDFKDPNLPLISGIDGRLVSTGSEIKERLTAQIDAPIFWQRVADVLAAHDLIIIVGPGAHMSELIKQLYPDANVISVSNKTDIEKIKSLMPQPESTTEIKESNG